jgi:hypothetical protein
LNPFSFLAQGPAHYHPESCYNYNDIHCNRSTEKCLPGYRKDPSRDFTAYCEDINECLNPILNNCIQICLNNIGSYNCSCRPGYVINSQNICIDIDECHKNITICGGTKKCQNTIGSYYCICKREYETDDDGNCIERNNLITRVNSTDLEIKRLYGHKLKESNIRLIIIIVMAIALIIVIITAIAFYLRKRRINNQRRERVLTENNMETENHDTNQFNSYDDIIDGTDYYEDIKKENYYYYIDEEYKNFNLSGESSNKYEMYDYDHGTKASVACQYLELFDGEVNDLSTKNIAVN